MFCPLPQPASDFDVLLLFLVQMSLELNQNVGQHGLKLFFSTGRFGIGVFPNTNEYNDLAGPPGAARVESLEDASSSARNPSKKSPW
jgi:hypothetical protein